MTGRASQINASAPLAHARAVLFDLDGTLIDSAPDLGGAGNDLRARRSLPALPLERFRSMTGSGARGMVGVALQIGPGDPGYEEIREEYLAIYEARMTRETHVFPHMRPLLHALDGAGLPWGIVTNKHTRYAQPVVSAVGLAERAAVLVCGDTTARPKPHPDSLLEAARRIGVPAQQCVYVGDDLRDVQAGRAAAMTTVAVTWGYVGDGVGVEQWDAHHAIDHPKQLLNLLGLA